MRLSLGRGGPSVTQIDNGDGTHSAWDGKVLISSPLGSTLVDPTAVSAGVAANVEGATVIYRTVNTAGADIGYFLCSINGIDDTTDAARISKPGSRTSFLLPDSINEIDMDESINRVSIVAVGQSENLAQGVITNKTSVANIITALATWEIPGSGSLRISISPAYTSAVAGETNAKIATVQVIGGE